MGASTERKTHATKNQRVGVTGTLTIRVALAGDGAHVRTGQQMFMGLWGKRIAEGVAATRGTLCTQAPR